MEVTRGARRLEPKIPRNSALAAGHSSKGAVGERIPQEVGTPEIGRSAPAPEFDLLVAARLAFANLPVECDCHIASSA